MRAWVVTGLAGASLFAAGRASSDGPSIRAIVPDRELREDAKLVSIATAFAEAYGRDFGGVGRNAEREIVFRVVGRDLLYDDGKKKTFDEMLDSPDLEDSFSQVYPIENPIDKVAENADPGRIRVEAMFKALYGDDAAEVAQHCIDVDFLGHRVRFSARCGAANALERAAKDLAEVVARKPELKTHVAKIGGTFNWRFIAGTKRLSNHSFANAIDLNVEKADYWKWHPADRLSTFSRKDYPVEIITAFERHGFIWGGKWWHYDTMHFEYRPELIAYARQQGKTSPAASN